MNPLLKVGIGAGALLLGYSIFQPKKAYAGETGATSKGLDLAEGEQAVITTRLEPMTAAQWRQVAANPGMMAQISANVFPQVGPLRVDSFVPAPATGVFTATVTAKQSTTFVPSVQSIGNYTVTTLASREA
jgi:hypothetical protein